MRVPDAPQFDFRSDAFEFFLHENDSTSRSNAPREMSSRDDYYLSRHMIFGAVSVHSKRKEYVDVPDR